MLKRWRDSYMKRWDGPDRVYPEIEHEPRVKKTAFREWWEQHPELNRSAAEWCYIQNVDPTYDFRQEK